MSRNAHGWGLSPVALVLILVTAPGCTDNTRPEQTGQFPALLQAAELKSTDVLPHTEGPITPGRNYVYCGTFQLAWNEIQDNMLNEPARLEGDPAMAAALNRQSFRKSDLAEASYLAMAGSVKDGIVEKIRSTMDEKFPTAGMEPGDPAADTLIYAYAYLAKTLSFRAAFDRLDDPMVLHVQNKQVPVAAFGVKGWMDTCERDHMLARQVTILDYQNDDDFILRLNTTSTGDEIVLAKIVPKPTLGETVEHVRQRIARSKLKGSSASLHEQESLIVPIVALNVERAYSELTGKDLLNRGWAGYYVTEARQGIHFRLDERGARVESDATWAVGAESEKPRQFIFDKPFLLYLKQTNSNAPYLAVWIETAELLEKAPASKSAK